MEQLDNWPVSLLSEDVFADVLRRLAPRSLAVSRCVCKAWRTVIDRRRLLRADLLPRSLGGIFIEFNMLGLLEFFAAPPTTETAAVVSGDLRYVPYCSVYDHCNGLLLLYDGVANPATRQWAPLPLKPDPRVGTVDVVYEVPYPAFDPTFSPDINEVFLVPVVPCWAVLEDDATAASSEWLPALYETHVLSSLTGRWEEWSFVREGEPVGTMADVRPTMPDGKCYGVSWRGALYVHCQSDFFIKLSSSSDKYQVIKPPAGVQPDEDRACRLGRSEHGVYFAILDGRFRLRVWILKEEPSGHTEWVLKHENNLEQVLGTPECHRQGDWILENINYNDYINSLKHGDGDEDGEVPAERELKLEEHSYLYLLGFHPFKEVVFFNSILRRGLAYDLNSSKVQDLGYMRPTHYGSFAGQHADINASFPYTPCWMENPLPAVHLQAPRKD